MLRRARELREHVEYFQWQYKPTAAESDSSPYSQIGDHLRDRGWKEVDLFLGLCHSVTVLMLTTS